MYKLLVQRLFSFFLISLCVLLLFFPANAQEKEGAGQDDASTDMGRAYYDFGVFAFEDGDYEDAEENFLRALEFSPADPFCNQFLGKTYLKTSRYFFARKYLNVAWALNRDIPGLKYDLGFLNYKTSKYAEAAALFSDAAKEQPSNILAHYYAGISLYKQKAYRRALDYFISASEKSPSIRVNSSYYAGICYLKTRQTEKALEKLKYVKDNADSDALRQNASKLIRTIELQKISYRPYSLFMKLGYGYDDNVRLEPLDQDVFADEGDYVAVGYFNGGYQFVNRDEFKLGAGGSYYQTRHNNLEEFDLIGGIFNAYAAYILHPVALSLSYVPSYYWLDHESYLMRHLLRPEMTWHVHDNFYTSLSYSYYKNTHFQNSNRDGHTNDILLSANCIFSRKGALFGGIGYEDTAASHPDESYTRLRTRLGVSIALPWQFNVTLTGNYAEKEFDNVDSLIGIRRKDIKYFGSIHVFRRLFVDWLGLTGELDYSKNDSNISDFDYERRVIMVSVTGRF